MSGQAGFVLINSQTQIRPNVIRNADNVDNNVAPNGVQQPNAPQQQPVAAPPQQRPTAHSIAQRLDILLATAAQTASKTVEQKDVADALKGVSLRGSSTARQKLLEAADGAMNAMKSVAQYTGREIGESFSMVKATVENINPKTGEKSEKSIGVYEWDEENLVAIALENAIDAQAQLSEKLRAFAAREGIPDETFYALEELAMQCDRRMSELSTLAMQMADAVTLTDGDEEQQAAVDVELSDSAKANLDVKVSEIVKKEAVEMHGTAGALEMLKEKFEPLAASVELFASRPNSAISQSELLKYQAATKNARQALENLASHGIETKTGRILFDSSLLGAASELVKFAEDTLEDTRRKIGLESLKRFAEKIFPMDKKKAIFSKENMHLFPDRMKDTIRLRYTLRDKAIEYAEKPSQDLKVEIDIILAEILKLSGSYSRLDRTNLAKNLADTEFKVDNDDQLDAIVEELRASKTLDSQVAHFIEMVESVHDPKLAEEKFLSTSSANDLLEGRISLPTMVEARIHGMADSDIDPSLDDSRLVSSKTLGSGAANTVSLLTYADGKERVFKPESPGRQGMSYIVLSKDYEAKQQVANLNLASQDTAVALNAMDVMPKCSVGCHDGEYGLFMEKAEGMDGANFSCGRRHRKTEFLTADDVSRLPLTKYREVAGGVMRGLNRLQWLDLVTGQGDRHDGNYMIAVKSDYTVTVKGIDNDEAFSAYRSGLHTYTIKGGDTGKFNLTLAKIAQQYPKTAQNDPENVLTNDPGLSYGKDGSITIDTTKIKNPVLLYAAQNMIGMHGASLPTYIDEDMCNSLLELKSGEKREAYLANLARRIPKDAVESAKNRLDQAIALAEKYRDEGKVIKKEDFAKPDVQDRLVTLDKADAAERSKPVAINGHVPNDDAIDDAVADQTQSIFLRDIYKDIKHPAVKV